MSIDRNDAINIMRTCVLSFIRRMKAVLVTNSLRATNEN